MNPEWPKGKLIDEAGVQELAAYRDRIVRESTDPRLLMNRLAPPIPKSWQDFVSHETTVPGIRRDIQLNLIRKLLPRIEEAIDAVQLVVRAMREILEETDGR